MTPDNILIGQRILNARIKAGLSQGDLSKLAGLSQPNISLYEHGKQKPTTTALYSIAKACDVSCDYLLGLSDGMGISIDKNVNTDERFVLNRLLEKGELQFKEDSDMICLIADKSCGYNNAVEYLSLLRKDKNISS